jgi:hypothetical protein
MSSQDDEVTRKTAIEHFLEETGQSITGQINVSYNTQQTLDQFLEIRYQQEQEKSPNSFLDHEYLFDEELFLEYVLDNVAQVIRDEVLYNGDKSLKREITLLSEWSIEL